MESAFSHLTTGEVLEPLIAVEATAVLSDLGQPRPHVLDRSVDRHRAGHRDAGIGDQLVAGKWFLGLVGCRAPRAGPGRARARYATMPAQPRSTGGDGRRWRRSARPVSQMLAPARPASRTGPPDMTPKARIATPAVLACGGASDTPPSIASRRSPISNSLPRWARCDPPEIFVAVPALSIARAVRAARRKGACCFGANVFVVSGVLRGS